jgi:HEAT repeat protein
MSASEKVAELINKLPGPDNQSIKNKESLDEVERILADVLSGGRENLVALVGLLEEPKAQAKARYALHALAVSVCRGKGREKRELFSLALASTLDGKQHKEVKSFVIGQLRVAGGKEVAGALGKHLNDETLCEPAAGALLAIKHGAAEQFRAALAAAKGKQRLTIVQALGVLRDEKSSEALKKLVADSDRDTRLAALWAVANIGSPGLIDTVLKAADTKESYERIKSTQACLLLAERLRSSGKKSEAGRIYKHLQDTRTEPHEKYVRDAAIKALAHKD